MRVETDEAPIVIRAWRLWAVSYTHLRAHET